MNKVIEHKLGVKQANLLVKKAASGKMAVVSDNGTTLKLGTPPFMVFGVTVSDTQIIIGGKGPGEILAKTLASEIDLLLADMPEEKATPKKEEKVEPKKAKISPEEYLSYHERAVKVIEDFKRLYDAGTLSEEEFKTKKEDILNFISGMTR